MCLLLKHLIANGLESLMSLSKIGLKIMSEQDISKDGMIKNVSDTMLNNYGNANNGMLALVDEEERDEDLI